MKRDHAPSSLGRSVGDFLLKRGKSKDALAKYDAALKFTPNWNYLKES